MKFLPKHMRTMVCAAFLILLFVCRLNESESTGIIYDGLVVFKIPPL